MTFIKAITGVLVTLVVISNGQLLTPDEVREQHNLGLSARTHYELTEVRRTDMFHRINPDYLFRGFFPFWSIVLLALALAFLTVAIIGLLGFLLGCRRPTPEEIHAKEFQQLRLDEEALLQGDGSVNPHDIRISANGYTNNNPAFSYKSSPLAERTRIGHSGEDMV